MANLGCLDILDVRDNGDDIWGNPELMTAIRGPRSRVRVNLDGHEIWAGRRTQ
jgi:hypothetical protein